VFINCELSTSLFEVPPENCTTPKETRISKPGDRVPRDAPVTNLIRKNNAPEILLLVVLAIRECINNKERWVLRGIHKIYGNHSLIRLQGGHSFVKNR
jgi:hypothetical protein